MYAGNRKFVCFFALHWFYISLLVRLAYNCDKEVNQLNEYTYVNLQLVNWTSEGQSHINILASEIKWQHSQWPVNLKFMHINIYKYSNDKHCNSNSTGKKGSVF